MSSHSTIKSNAFADAIDSTVGSKAPHCSGENGSDMYTMYGVRGAGDPVIGALVALFNGVVDTTSHETIVQFIDHVTQELDKAKHLTDEQKANFYADLVVAAFQVRNIRDNGKGRRDQTYSMWVELLWRFPKTMMALLPELKEHGYWKDYNHLLEKYHSQAKYRSFYLKELIDAIYDLYVEQVKLDRETLDDYNRRKAAGEVGPDEKCELSLAVKFLPKEGRALDKKIHCTKELAKRMFAELFAQDFKKAMKALRHFYAPIQKAIHTTEVLECAKEFHRIQFRFVPGKALFKKKKAYLYEHKKGGKLRGDDANRLKCRENYLKHLEKAAKGQAKVHGKTVYIHELVSAVYSNWGNLTQGDRLTYNAQFQSHVDHFKELMEEKGLAINKGMFMPDVSGSMAGDPMAAAIAVSLLGSTLAEGPWKDRFMTFESNPHWVILRYPKDHHDFQAMVTAPKNGSYRNNLCGYSTHPLGTWDPSRADGDLTFCEKVAVCYSSPWGGSTDFLAAHELMLSIAKEHNIAPEDFPDWFLTPSDMQFNQANGSGHGTYPTMCNLLGERDWAAVTRRYVHGYTRYDYNSQHRYGYGTQKPQVAFKDHHKILVDVYKAAGYTLPQMIYWNMRDTKKSLTTADQTNVQMVSGFSTMQLKLFLENLDLDMEEPVKPTVTPWDTFRKAIDDECYNDVRKTIVRTAEGPFAHYVLVHPDGDSDGDTDYDMPELVPDDGTVGASAHSTGLSISTTVEPPTPTPSVTSTASTKSNVERLREAKSMLDEGLISQHDFDGIKSKVMGDM